MAKMKTFEVFLPITGTLRVEIKANNDEDAIKKALASELTVDMIETWEAHKTTVEGNIFHGERNNAEAVEM